MVSDFLDELIEDSPSSAFERATLPQGIEERLAKVDWDRREVMIGFVRNDEQMQRETITIHTNRTYPRKNARFTMWRCTGKEQGLNIMAKS
ncbi:MAG: hypothetical protein LUE29_02860 [Lachnospiraceae bacterium]|nr:hypothetical protein [Lachnospiraceae bacterium]